MDNFLGKSKFNFWTKKEDFEQCGLDRLDLLYTSKDRKIPGPARNDREVPGTTRRHRDIPEITGKQASRCDRFLIFYDHLSNRKYSREEGDLSILKKHFHKT